MMRPRGSPEREHGLSMRRSAALLVALGRGIAGGVEECRAHSGVHHLFTSPIYVQDTDLPAAVLEEAASRVLERYDAWIGGGFAGRDANDAFFDAQASWTRAWIDAYDRCNASSAAACAAAADACEGGWPDVLPSRSPAFAALWEAIASHARRFVALNGFAGVDTEGLGQPWASGEHWFAVHENGSSHAPHVHPGCALSGTLYLAAPRDAGHIRFQDPRRLASLAALLREGEDDDVAAVARERLFDAEVAVPPRPGTLVLFPPWIKHYVEPTAADGARRVALSFNLDGRWGATSAATATADRDSSERLAVSRPDLPPFEACKQWALEGYCRSDPANMLRACAAVCEIFLLAEDVRDGVPDPPP